MERELKLKDQDMTHLCMQSQSKLITHDMRELY